MVHPISGIGLSLTVCIFLHDITDLFAFPPDRSFRENSLRERYSSSWKMAIRGWSGFKKKGHFIIKKTYFWHESNSRHLNIKLNVKIEFNCFLAV